MSFDNQHNEHCDWVLDRLEAYLDGDLSTDELAPIESHLTICGNCTRELGLARQVQSMLHALPEHRCPDAVVEAAARRINGLPAPATVPLTERLSGWWHQFMHPIAAAAAMLLVVAMTVFIGQEHHYNSTASLSPEDTLELSAEDIALAEAEIKWTLAYLGDVGRRSGRAVRDEAIINHVVKPVGRALDTAFHSRSTGQTN
jgi:anti-sigma factor (TIGR02949 family)